MEIIKSKRKSKCRNCGKPINQKYKVVVCGNIYYHLRCYFKGLERRLEQTKKELKLFSKQKYKKQMIIESL